MSYVLDAMPEGYCLQEYDDCGVTGRQPHVFPCGSHTYSPSHVDADERARTVAWDWTEVGAAYDGLDSDLDYVLAVTYANEPYNDRVQSLWAGDIQLHGPRPLPRGGVERLLIQVPREAVRAGRLELRFRLEGPVNVVVSAIELWAPKPSPRLLRLDPIAAPVGDLEGRVLDLGYDPVGGASLVLKRADTGVRLASAVSNGEGRFRFARSAFTSDGPSSDLVVEARLRGMVGSTIVPAASLAFEPVRYRPMPTRLPGVRAPVLCLDGTWRVQRGDGDSARGAPLDAAAWRDFRVPGQWLQQGLDVRQDEPVAVATEFTIPDDWAGHRVFLRFDAIHGGTDHWLNGTHLGYSENLFTPVEWEITDAVRYGEANRLDLEMVVDTLSERLSYASGYAFHNLGGIDRSVRLFALPRSHIRAVRVRTDLLDDCAAANLQLRVTLDNSGPAEANGLSLHLALVGADARPVDLSVSRVAIGRLPPGERECDVISRVPTPKLWSAEKPNLYRLLIDLRQNGKLLERIERTVGFRDVEVRGSQLYVNGARVKLAGSCRHETDPLTGRADTARHAEQDVRLIKSANLNYIRTAHYPPTEEFLDAADRLGMYVEVEAPFCWVGDDNDPTHLSAVLTPTSAMVDACHAHPSVIIWSLANESHFNRLFEASAALVRELDPTRPTTFNNPDPKRVCDIANLHYPPAPYDRHIPDDPRPVLLGEYFFPVCHEQTDVMVNPGLRELWGAGHSDPDSGWGRACIAEFGRPFMQPGIPPGSWTEIVRSERVIGGAIWAALDEPFYLPDGRKVGYAWVHGFWGLIDAWRRPKPEWWLAKLIFSPVWFPVRRLDLPAEAAVVGLPVENRYSFTDLSELRFHWELGRTRGTATVACPPGGTATLEIPRSPEAADVSELLVRVVQGDGELVTVAVIELAPRAAVILPAPSSGSPDWRRDGESIVIEGSGWGLSLNVTTGKLIPVRGTHYCGVTEFPSVHVTRFDFGDLVPNAPPYAVLPRAETRVIEGVEVTELQQGLRITVRDSYDCFKGATAWLLDRDGVGVVEYDYAYTGDEMSAREVGLRFLLTPACQELRWRRWSEWGLYPDDSPSRTAGVARAHRDPALGPGAEGSPPNWPWALDETELGTNDFRGVKLHVYEASLAAPDGSGLSVQANADAHVRACLAPHGVWLHVLSECRLAPVTLRPGDRIAGSFVVVLGTPTARLLQGE